MTTYVQKRTRMFMERPDWLRPERRRSESRLKTYPSSTDVRNWCDVVEDRRQHILELVVKGMDKCTGKLVPLDVLVDMLLAMGAGDPSKLKTCLKQLWDFVFALQLSDEDMKKLKLLVEGMDDMCKEGAAYSRALGLGIEVGADECDPKCVATLRHSQEQKEIDQLVKGTLITRPTIETRMTGPGKMVTRIKGLQPGFQVIDDPSKPTRITIKPSRRPEAAAEAITSKSLQETPNNAMLRSAIPPNSGPDKLAATEALCKEQRDKIESLTKERDDLKTKLEACLKELDNFKKLQTVANPSLPASCQQEIEALEAEIKIMRSGNPSPEEEAEIIKKEVEILKKYCGKLKEVESENEKLKVELGSRVAIKDSQFDMDKDKVETLKDKLKNLEDLTKERDSLANRVHELEKQLLQYQSLPGDVDVMRNKSDMLDSVMQERDGLSQKVKMMKSMEEELQKLRGKADRVDQLERELKNMSKGDRSSGFELKKTRSIAGNLEVELQNMKSERDAMKKRIDSLKKEMDSQKAKVTEAEMLRLERDRLQIKLNELSDVQAQYEDMMNKMKIFDNLKAERDMYKQKYEDVLDMECKCDMLKTQVDEARAVGRERDHLQKQVEDLEACICEQEDEIKSLVLQVDSLSRTKADTNNRINSYREEITRKDRMLAASQEQLVQSQSLNSRVRELEKLLHNAEHTIIQKDCHIKCLENQMGCKTGSLNASKALNKREIDVVDLMRKELEAAKAENRKLQEVANKMMSISGDDHVKKMLKQSECAVKRVVQEIGKQYKEWDQIKSRKDKGKFGSNRQDCSCYSAGEEISSGDDCEKLREELEELQKEKRKLESTVKQLQGESVSKVTCPGGCRTLGKS